MTTKTVQQTPEVGMGATLWCGTDRYAHTISRVSASGKTFWMRQDVSTRTDQNGLSESQTYSYSPNPDAKEIRTSRCKDGKWRSEGQIVWLGVRSTYRDPSF